MNLSDISTKITSLTGADTTQYPNANRLIDINVWNRRVDIHILKSQDGFDFDDSNNSDFPIWTTNLVANQQDYALPSGMLELKRVEITYDNGATWHKATPFDIGQREKATASNAISDFTTANPYYDPQYNSIFLYPIPIANGTASLKLWGTRTITEFTLSDLTTGTLSPGFDANFHDIDAYGPAFEFCLSHELPRTNAIKNELNEKLALLENHYGKKNTDEIASMTKQYSSYK